MSAAAAEVVCSAVAQVSASRVRRDAGQWYSCRGAVVCVFRVNHDLCAMRGGCSGVGALAGVVRVGFGGAPEAMQMCTTRAMYAWQTGVRRPPGGVGGGSARVEW